MSNVTGHNLDLLRTFIGLLSARMHYNEDKPAEFQIDETYSVPVSRLVNEVLKARVVGYFINVNNIDEIPQYPSFINVNFESDCGIQLITVINYHRTILIMLLSGNVVLYIIFMTATLMLNGTTFTTFSQISLNTQFVIHVQYMHSALSVQHSLLHV